MVVEEAEMVVRGVQTRLQCKVGDIGGMAQIDVTEHLQQTTVHLAYYGHEVAGEGVAILSRKDRLILDRSLGKGES